LTLPRSARIRAVLFDFGMVLSGPPEPRAWARMLEASDLDNSALHAGYWAHRHDYDRGALTGQAYWHAVGQSSGRSFTANQIASLIAADTDLWTDLNQPMVDWAARLQQAEIRTGILSNIGDAIAEGICAKCGWIAAFDHCTWSHALNMAKPDPEIYIETAKALGVAPDETLFIDDREDNIFAALALGFQAIRYTSHAEFEREMRERNLGWLLDARAQPEASTLASKAKFL
jgi:putative hydrolase of the HAD superfamily